MSEASTLAPAAGDVVAVRLPPGEAWRDIVSRVWAAEAVLFPIDDRLAGPAVADLISRARPTMIVDGQGWRRLPDGRSASGLGLLIATSGSRDRPRLVELSREAVLAAVEASTRALGARASDPWVSCLPLAHIGGLLVVLRALLTGAPLEFRVPSRLAGGGGAFTSLVPTILERALEGGLDLRDYRTILVGGSGLSAGLAERARAAGLACVATYGLSQSCGGVIYDGVPLPGVGLRISGTGEIEIGGPTLMRGYRDDPAGTDRARSTDGWLRTGDAGCLDARGRLGVIGRLDDMIVTGGDKVWPPDVEAVLQRHPLVAEAVVVGREDPTWGQRVVAVIVPRDPASPPSLPELREWVGGELGRHQAPRELVAVDQLPRTALGKVRMTEVVDHLRGRDGGFGPAPPHEDDGG